MAAPEVVVRWAVGDAHELLCDVVAASLRLPREAVGIRRECPRCGGPHGRPLVTIDGEPGPSASIARAGSLSVVAVADRDVGVDVEPAAERSEIAAVALSPAEQAALLEVPVSERGARVLRTWVRKEAVLKALGHGLLVDPSLVGLRDGPRPRLDRWDGPGPKPAIRIADVGDVDRHVLAVAVVGWRRPRIDVEAWSGFG